MDQSFLVQPFAFLYGNGWNIKDMRHFSPLPLGGEDQDEGEVNGPLRIGYH